MTTSEKLIPIRMLRKMEVCLANGYTPYSALKGEEVEAPRHIAEGLVRDLIAEYIDRSTPGDLRLMEDRESAEAKRQAPMPYFEMTELKPPVIFFTHSFVSGTRQPKQFIKQDFAALFVEAAGWEPLPVFSGTKEAPAAKEVPGLKEMRLGNYLKLPVSSSLQQNVEGFASSLTDGGGRLRLLRSERWKLQPLNNQDRSWLPALRHGSHDVSQHAVEQSQTGARCQLLPDTDDDLVA